MRRTVVTTFTTALAVVALMVPLACGSSGRDLRPPAEGATAPPRRPDPVGTVASSPTTAAFFSLSSDAWSPGGPFPEAFTCDGDDTSPPLTISAVPPGTVELAIVMLDQDADRYVHWAIAGIDPSTVEISEGAVPPEAVTAKNSAGKIGYTGPCPPSGTEHDYQLTLHALDAPSGVTEGQSPSEAIAAIEAQHTAMAVLTATYRKR